MIGEMVIVRGTALPTIGRPSRGRAPTRPVGDVEIEPLDRDPVVPPAAPLA
jgi:hypothetical protein